jgi:hypothetical protein
MSKNETADNKGRVTIGDRVFNTLAEALAAGKPGETIRMQGGIYVGKIDSPSRIVNCKVHNSTGSGILVGETGRHSVVENCLVYHHEDESSED